MFVEHGKLYYFVMANYTILSWQFSTRILPWLFSDCRPKEHGNFPFCSMVNLFFITMANFILHLLLQIFLFLTHGKFTFTAMAKLHILPWQFFYFFILPWQYFLLLCHGKFWIHWHGNFHLLFRTTIFSFIEMENLHLLLREIYFNIHCKSHLSAHGKFYFYISMAILFLWTLANLVYIRVKFESLREFSAFMGPW